MTKYCKVCGNQIPPARVAALPTAVTCVSCAEGRVPRKLVVTSLVGGEEHGYTHETIVTEDQFEGYTAETRDILDVEPEQFAREEGRPITIRKRSQL